MTDREKLIELIIKSGACFTRFPVGDCDKEEAETIADHLIANGVTFATDNNVGNKRIEELEAKLAEREEAVCNLRKKWQEAETHICTMCGHFDHKTDGNIVYGNKNCGELVGYPCCEKFTPWIPVTERLPSEEEYTATSEDGTEYYARLLIAYKTDIVEYEIGYYDGYKWMT